MDWLFEVSHATPLWALIVGIILLTALPLGPAEATAVTASTFVSASVLPLWGALVAVAFGMLLGDVLVYRGAGKITDQLQQRPRMRHKLLQWEHSVRRHPGFGHASAIGLRFVPGARIPVVLAVRAAGMGQGLFLLLAAVGSLLWSAFWVAGLAAVTEAPLLGVTLAILVLAGILLCTRTGSRRSPHSKQDFWAGASGEFD